MTNKHVGVFAGMADIQGIDFYNAACAPHITEFGVIQLRGPYDYLRTPATTTHAVADMVLQPGNRKLGRARGPA